jgi:hypothetical protein
MGRSYEDVADAAEDAGLIDPEDVTEQEVQARIRDFAVTDDVTNESRLLSEATDAAMEQDVGFVSAEGRDYGGNLGERENIETWTDRWGNIMGNNTERDTTPKKIVDSSER